ncbi:hypothetical protein HPP92_006847 [Vanilla planifolia]|uniref:Uncharacterized protein n=1 Tax=Vanilla planifolia TaxID=51239 RepID=A0A835V9H8_VANPL|nr:hypothetical protein HPP92_006847 [Vanilla planifolia]
MDSTKLFLGVLLLLLLQIEVLTEELVLPSEEIDCKSSCARRCSEAGNHKRCMRACQSCCARCHCVPPGTYGHKEECPCYANMKTKGGRPKCP